MRGFVLGSVALIVALAFAASAFGGLKAKPYRGQGGNVQGQVAAGNGVRGATAGVQSTGTLPFTGQDLAFIAIGGAVLILAGTGFYRLNRDRR